MATVSIVFRADRINNKGEAPINFFITKDRKTTKVATGKMIHQKHWDEKHKKVKASHPNSAQLNVFISRKFSELNGQVLENETNGTSHSSAQLKDDLYGKKPIYFFEYAETVLERYKNQGQVGTHDRCKAIINKVKEYQNHRLISFQQMTAEYLIKYEKHLRLTKKNSTNTIHTNFKFIRQLFNDVINQNLMDSKFDSFKRFKVKTEKTQRMYLTEDELTAIEEADCSSGVKLELHRDMFVFASYTGGLRVSDVLKLKWKYIDKTHINFTIKKTGSQLSIKVPDKALAILEKYKSEAFEKEHYIFPMLPNGLDETDNVKLDNDISTATAYINKNLKTIAKKADVDKPLSFHISRHTWATRALRKGISIDKVSKLMGHAQIKETQIYAKIVNGELDKAMDVFND